MGQSDREGEHAPPRMHADPPLRWNLNPETNIVLTKPERFRSAASSAQPAPAFQVRTAFARTLCPAVRSLCLKKGSFLETSHGSCSACSRRGAAGATGARDLRSGQSALS